MKKPLAVSLRAFFYNFRALNKFNAENEANIKRGES